MDRVLLGAGGSDQEGRPRGRSLAETTAPFGASWGADDTIVVGQDGQGILRVTGAGGTPDVLVAVNLPAVAHQPQMLSGGDAVLYTLGTLGSPGRWDTAQIVVERVATGERSVLVEGGSDARYVPTGHLVYAQGGTLLAVPFDVDRLVVTGSPVPLVEGISRAGVTGAANADISRTGVLVNLPVEEGPGGVRTLVWVDRDGTENALAAPPRDYVYPRLSPDGRRVILDARDEENDVWVWDLRRETLTRLTFEADADYLGMWTPDGQRVVFGSIRGGSAPNLYWRAADGTGAVERLTESPNTQWPEAISPDGARLVFSERTPATSSNLHVLTFDDDRRVAPLFVTEFDERNAAISPDGRWFAYESNASGRARIYVRPFPDVDAGRWQISSTRSRRPRWGPDGQELFYLTPAGVGHGRDRCGLRSGHADTRRRGVVLRNGTGLYRPHLRHRARRATVPDDQGRRHRHCRRPVREPDADPRRSELVRGTQGAGADGAVR